MNAIQRHEYFAIRFYNAISGEQCDAWDQIPEHAKNVLIVLDYAAIVSPFVAEYIKEGASRHQTAIKFGITPDVARGIGKSCGVLPRQKPGNKTQ